VTGDTAAGDPDAAEERGRQLELAVRAVVVIALVAVSALILPIGPSRDSHGVVPPGSQPASDTASPGFTLAPYAAAPSVVYPSAPTTAPSPSAVVESGPSLAAKAPLVTNAVVHSWQAGGITRVQVLAAIRNPSSTPIEFVPSGSRYRIIDRAGHELSRGVFTYAAPDRLAPGEEAYLIDTASTLFAVPSDIAKVDVEPVTRPTESAATLLPTQNVEWKRAADGGLLAMGDVSNNTQAEIASAFVCVVVFGKDGKPLAGVYDLTDIRQLPPGGTKHFTTSYPGTPPIAAGDVSRVEAIALELHLAAG
jgi:hypothetical protein